MTRLPTPGSDDGTWGTVLNDFLNVEHNSDGTLKQSDAITGAQQKSALTAKGDLYVATASGVTTRLGVGSNGQVLTADSATTPGVKWATASSGAGVDPSVASLGLVAQTYAPNHSDNSFSFGSGLFAACLVYLPGSAVATLGMGIRSGFTGSTGTNELAIYRLVSATSAVLVDKTGDMTATLATAPAWASGSLIGGSQVLAAGVYYLAALTHFSSPGQAVAGIATDNSFGANLPAINGRYLSVYQAGQTSMPASFNPGALSLNSAMYYLTAS